ncbi:hypothetical protein Q3G72_029833 [Acer saccharum]|nr:hypothetical protein Q3G72_029833 [Acer saccharum]
MQPISLSNSDTLDHGSYDLMKQKELEVAMALVLLSERVPPELRILIESFNGTDILLVMEKTLKKSDLDSNQNRLSFGVDKVKNQFLITKDELDKVNQPGGLQVTVIQPCLEITPKVVELRKRTKNGCYFEFVLTGNWRQIAQNKMNRLQTDDKVTLWSFRKGSDLCFALVKA